MEDYTIEKLCLYLSIMHRAATYVPETKEALRECVWAKKCSYANPNQNRHVVELLVSYVELC